MPGRARQRGFIVNPYGSSADPYFSSVTMLLHFQGSNAGTTFTDVKGATITPHGNAQTSTAQFKWGTSSGLFDGSGDYLTATGAVGYVMTTEDHTLEAWVRPSTVSGVDMIASNRATASSDVNWALFLNAGVLSWTVWGPNPGQVLVNISGGSALPTATWTHVAATRSGTAWSLMYGGAQVASATASGNMASDTSKDLYIGKDPSTTGRDWDGYIGEFRITKGVARYTGATYTVPASPFPDF